MRSLYRALDLAPGADDAQIKAAFRDLAKKSHPDVSAGDAGSAERFKEVHRAYRLLRDPHTRAVLDHMVAEARATTRRRWLMSMATMAAVFVLTVGSGLLFLAWRADHQVAILADTKAPAVEPERGAAAKEAKPAQMVAAIPAVEEPGQKRTQSGPPTAHAAPLVAETDRLLTEKPQPKKLAAAETISSWAPAPAIAPQTTERQEVWSAYQSTRFGFSLKYPAHVFAPVADEQDGEVLFVSHDGRARLRVSGRPFSRALTLPVYRRKLIEQRYGGAALERTPLHKTWFALSGSLGDKKFYERVVCSCDGRALHVWQLTYPPAERAFYEPIVDEIRRSYRREGEDEEGHCRRSQA
jgi:hypothetical protein